MEHMKTISTGHFDLFKIYSVVAGCPKFLFGREELKIYSAVVNSIIENVPKKAGLYLWGRFNDTGWWETIYLGKAGNKKKKKKKKKKKRRFFPLHFSPPNKNRPAYSLSSKE